jgi:predicted transcriptional regulator
VSRAQINIRSLHTIKQQMRQNDWITPVGRDDRQRMLWRMTEKCVKLLEGYQRISQRSSIF